MDTENKATGQERPPLGSEEAISEIVEALLNCGDDWERLRRLDADIWPSVLHDHGHLPFKPHYLELVEALRELGWVRVSGPLTGTPEDMDNPEVMKTWPEDMFRKYVARERRGEIAQRRQLAARRRRDAEKLGLSAEESDRAEERREELWTELDGLGFGPEFFVGPPPPPTAWQPDEAALAEGQRRYHSYLDRMIRWHFERPDIHPPLRSHDGNKMIRDYAWEAMRERRAAEICEELDELGEDMEGGWAAV